MLGTRGTGSRPSSSAKGSRSISVSCTVRCSHCKAPRLIVAALCSCYPGLHDTAEQAARAYDAKAIELYGPTAKTNFYYGPRAHLPRHGAFGGRVDSPAESVGTDSELLDDYDVVVLPLRKNLSPLIYDCTMTLPPTQAVHLPAPSPLVAAVEPTYGSALNRFRSHSSSSIVNMSHPVPSMTDRVDVSSRPTSQSWDSQQPIKAKKASSPIGTKQARKMEAFNKLKLKLLDTAHDDCRHESTAFGRAGAPAVSPVNLHRTSTTTSETVADDDLDVSELLDLSLLSCCDGDMSVDEINFSEYLFDRL